MVTSLTNQYFISAMFRMCFFSPLSSFNDVRYEHYNKRITTHNNANVQSHHQQESKLNSTINANSGAHTVTDDKIVKIPFNKNNVATIKSK